MVLGLRTRQCPDITEGEYLGERKAVKVGLRDVRFDRLDLKDVQWPEDEEHVVVQDFPAALARALASDPEILLLDEPTEGIQPNIVELIQETIVRLNRELGLTILLVEQKVEFARQVAPRFVILEKGSIAAQGAIGEMSDDLVHRHLVV